MSENRELNAEDTPCIQMPIRPTVMYPTRPPNSTIQYQQHQAPTQPISAFQYQQHQASMQPNSAFHYQQHQATMQPISTTQYQQNQAHPELQYNHSYPNTSLFHEHNQYLPYPNMSFFQQSTQFPPTQSLSDSHVHQHSVHPTRSEANANQRNNKNWSKEEDLQLTVAWDRISMDPVVGVGQKKAKLWERILELFKNLMNEKHGINPKENVRTASGCENRMTDIKSQCSKWVAVRSRAFAQNHSGWSALVMEKLCQSMYETEVGKGPFKWEECWKVLKDSPKWLDYNNKKKGNNNTNSEGSQGRTQATSSSAPVNERSPIDLTSDNMQNEMPKTPLFVNTHSENELGGHSGSTCSPILDGPASIDVDLPMGNKRLKISNQRQRKIKKHSESQASVSKTLTAGMMTLESATSSRWETIQDENRKRDLKNDERYDEMKRMQALEHEMKVGKDRGELILQRELIGIKLLAAIQKLDQIDPASIVTHTQRLAYNIQKQAVEDFQEQHEVLGNLLKRTKEYSSPSSVSREENIASAGISSRRLFSEDEVHLDHD